MTRLRYLSLLLTLSLLLAACQPLVLPDAAGDAAPAAAPQSTPLPGFSRYHFPDLGIAVDFPEDWVVRHDPKYGWIIAMSEVPETFHAWSSAYWWPAFEEPIASVNLQTRDLADFAEPTLEEIVAARFQTYSTSELQINPKGVATIVSGPERVTLGDREAVALEIEALDDNLRFPFRSYIAALTAGERVAFLAAGMTAANAAEQLPLARQIASTLEIVAPDPAAAFADIHKDALTLDEPVRSAIAPTEPTVSTRDLWSFSGAADQQMTLIAVPLSDRLDVVIDVLDSEGSSILGGEIDETMLQYGAREKITFNLPADGDYHAAVRGAFQTGGDYHLTLYEGFRAY